MISQVSNSFNFFPSLFQNSNQSLSHSNQSNLFGVTSIDNFVTQNATEQTLNLGDQSSTDNSTYDLLNNISNNSSFSGITNLDQFAQNNYIMNSNPSISQYNQATQSYNSSQNYDSNMYSLASSYDKSI